MKSILFGLLLAGAAALHAEAVKDREGAVRQDRARFESDERWAYNDPDRGFRQAQLTGKPLLVVLRCVPCVACAGIDAAVLMQEAELAPLLDQFICVRVINANALDLARFQFDFDLSFSTLFFNADGTVYGRYGSWKHQKDAQDRTLEGFKRTLETVLRIHRGYPANRDQLAGKQGAPLPYLTPVDMPALAGKYQRELNWDAKVVGSCVHCHMIGDALRASYRDRGQPVPTEWIHPMPAPETVGLTLAADQAAAVAQVAPGSAAARAGVLPGDVLETFGGQPLASQADFSWVLHRTGGAAELELGVRRGGAEQPLRLTLPEGWRHGADSSGRAAAWPMRAMATGGMVLVDLDDAARRERGLESGQMALRVKSLGQFGKHAAARNAGFQAEDILVAIAGRAQRMSESRLFAHLLQEHRQGESVPVTVLRGNRRLELRLPMQ